MKNGLPVSEADFTTAVIELAQYMGWMVCHFRPARTARGWRTAIQGDTGFPDLVLARKGHVLFVELKVGRNVLRADQRKWADAIGVTAHVWRPEDLRELIPHALR